MTLTRPDVDTMSAALMMLLLLRLRVSQASHYYGTVMTFTPQDVARDGSVTVGVMLFHGFNAQVKYEVK